MLKNLPKEEFGPQIDFREYSFLENPSLPKEVISSNLLPSLHFTLNAGNKKGELGVLIVSIWSVRIGERIVTRGSTL